MPGIDGTPEPERATAESGAGPTGEQPPQRRCPWCSALAPADASRCASCGASLAEDQSLGERAIPGVTEVDPAVREAELIARTRAKNANSPRPHVLGPIGGFAGGAVGYALGSAFDALVLSRASAYSPPPRSIDPTASSSWTAAKLDPGNTGAWNPYAEPAAAAGGTPNAASLDPWAGLSAPELRDRESAGPSTPAPVPAPPAGNAPPPPRGPVRQAGTFGDVETMAEAAEEPLAPGQLADPWSDLPAPSIADQVAGTEFDPWAAAPEPTPAAFDPWATPAPSGPGAPAAPDPWSFDGGVWSQDPWAGRTGTDRRPDEKPG